MRKHIALLFGLYFLAACSVHNEESTEGQILENMGEIAMPETQNENPLIHHVTRNRKKQRISHS